MKYIFIVFGMKMICLSLKILNLSRRFNFPFPICVGLKTFLVDLLQSPVHSFFQKKNRNVDGTIMYASLDHTKVGFLRVKFDLYLVEEGKQHMFLPVLERIVSFLGNDQRLSKYEENVCSKQFVAGESSKVDANTRGVGEDIKAR